MTNNNIEIETKVTPDRKNVDRLKMQFYRALSGRSYDELIKKAKENLEIEKMQQNLKGVHLQKMTKENRILQI